LVYGNVQPPHFQIQNPANIYSLEQTFNEFLIKFKATPINISKIIDSIVCPQNMFYSAFEECVNYMIKQANDNFNGIFARSLSYHYRSNIFVTNFIQQILMTPLDDYKSHLKIANPQNISIVPSFLQNELRRMNN
jgi:hypothetical protein